MRKNTILQDLSGLAIDRILRILSITIAILVLMLLSMPVLSQDVPPSPDYIKNKCLSENGTWDGTGCTCPDNKTFSWKWGCIDREKMPPVLCEKTWTAGIATEGLSDTCSCPVLWAFDQKNGCVISEQFILFFGLTILIGLLILTKGG
jgi:hypothetical protein